MNARLDEIRARLAAVELLGMHAYGNTVYFGPHGPDAARFTPCVGGGHGPAAWIAMPGATPAAEALASAPDDIAFLLAEINRMGKR